MVTGFVGLVVNLLQSNRWRHGQRPKKSYFSSACEYVKLLFSLRVLKKRFIYRCFYFVLDFFSIFISGEKFSLFGLYLWRSESIYFPCIAKWPVHKWSVIKTAQNKEGKWSCRDVLWRFYIQLPQLINLYKPNCVDTASVC
jgi:hypothetical protein